MTSDHVKSIRSEYFTWLLKAIIPDIIDVDRSYTKLLIHLHNTEFVYSIPRDANRAEDGINLRYRFSRDRCSYEEIEGSVNGPCSVLEMMVALAIRCEETIMDDPSYGDRTKQWFWNMINSLNLGSMTDSRFSESYTNRCLSIFLNRRYLPNGKGGLFTIRNCKYDLRKVEIWYQLNWYLNTFV